MPSALDSPLVVLLAALVAQWLAAFAGDRLGRRRRLKADQLQDFDIVRNAALTLLALIIGFSFSMAVSRYDQRKNYEEAEANAIGTAYARADLLSADEAARVRELLRQYTVQRIAFYVTRDAQAIERIDTATARLQAELWSTVAQPAARNPTAVAALVAAGINDVLNSQGYTQAAWWNRIPAAAWSLMGLIAIACNALFGYGERRSSPFVLLILPVIIAVAFFLIADIDSPRYGVVRVLPQNLVALSLAIGAR